MIDHVGCRPVVVIVIMIIDHIRPNKMQEDRTGGISGRKGPQYADVKYLGLGPGVARARCRHHIMDSIDGGAHEEDRCTRMHTLAVLF